MQSCSTCQQEAELELFKAREKTLDYSFRSVKKSASAKLENKFVLWSRRNVDDAIVTLEEDVGSVFKAVADFVQRNVKEVAQGAEVAFSEH